MEKTNGMMGERDIWPDPDRDDGHDHAACVVAALDRAEEICRDKGTRLTDIRRRVLKLVWRSHGPIGAYGILESLRLDNRRAAAPTVYRALNFLLAQGLIHRIESLNAYVGCPRPGTPHHGPFLICRDCGRSFELLDGQLDAVVDIDAAKAGFMVERRTLELHGLCPRCRGERDAELPAGGAGSEEGAPERVSGGVCASGKDTLPGADGGIQETPAAAIGLPLVEASGVHAHIGGQHILQGVNLSVHDGEIVTLIGPNGAGKTTLVRAVLGLLSVSRGRVFRRRGLRVGYMPQRMEVDHGMPLTVSRFLTLGGGASPHAIGPVLSEVGAGRLIDAPVQSISGGEWRRVLLARALLRNPDLLVLDEPVQGVDVTGQSELYRLISDVRDRHGCGVLMVSHDLHVVMEATDRVVCLNHHVCCTGRPEVVSRHPEYLSLFGAQAWRGVAVYTHHHDHEHDMHGDVLPFWDGGGRSSGRPPGPVDGAGEGGGTHG